MKRRANRREFLQTTAGAAAVGTVLGLPACAPQEQPDQASGTAPQAMIDFERSFFTWTSHPFELHPHYINSGGMTQGAGSVRNVRVTYDAKCEITNIGTGHVEELFLLSPCRSEYTIPKEEFFQLPSGEWRVIFSRTHRIPLARSPSTEEEKSKAGELNLADTRFTTRTHSNFTVLTSAKEVIEATLADKPLNARCTYEDDAGGYKWAIEYPARTMNLNVEEGLFQVDTGPIPLPDMKSYDGKRPMRAFFSYVAFSEFDSAEFILRREVEPSEEDKKWLFQSPGKWRYTLRDPNNPPPGHPPRPNWPSVFNETMVIKTSNQFLSAEI